MPTKLNFPAKDRYVSKSNHVPPLRMYISLLMRGHRNTTTSRVFSDIPKYVIGNQTQTYKMPFERINETYTHTNIDGMRVFRIRRVTIFQRETACPTMAYMIQFVFKHVVYDGLRNNPIARVHYKNDVVGRIFARKHNTEQLY